MPDPGISDLESLAASVLDRVLERPPDATALVFLVRCFSATDRDDVRNTLAEALAAALAAYGDEPDIASRAAWLTLFHNALALSDDERITSAVVSLVDLLRADWGATADIGDSSCSVEACLRAAESAALGAAALIPAAIDELERVVGQAYRPGGAIGSFRDHVCSASALLAAYDVTARLPYGMLAEELMQTAKRLPPEGRDFAMECGAARVFCRLAALHDDAEYRAAAILAPGADYRADTVRVLRALRARAGEGAAAYGLALLDYLSLQ